MQLKDEIERLIKDETLRKFTRKDTDERKTYPDTRTQVILIIMNP